MRRHSTATSSRSNGSKPSGPESSPPSGRIRLAVLLATVAAFLLVPAAQAAANGTMTVNLLGEGSGEISSVGGFEGSGLYEGTPPIQCSGPPQTGTCETELVEEEEEPGIESIFLKAAPDPGSEVALWIVEGGFIVGTRCQPQKGVPAEHSFKWEQCFPVVETGEGDIEVTVIFECTPEGEAENLCGSGPSGPTNKRLLTLTKSGPKNSAGTVQSKPKGIKCASTCSKAEASLYKNTVVTLSAKATTGSTFAGWSGSGCSGTGTCTVTMNEAKTVDAEFSGASKEVVNPKVLTVSKVDNGFETGFGTVKATGLTCEADCTATEAAYFGGVTEPKPKAAATVTLTAIKALGSSFVGWTGCDSNPTATECVVSMSTAKSVTAEFAALPKNTLTVNKSGTPNSAGTVMSKPKGIKCASACSTAQASYSEDSVITLTAKATTGSTFAGWSGGGCSGTGTCTVTMSSAKTVTAEFSGASKEVVNPKVLTLTKAGSGYGTVKGTGLTCEPACTTTQVAYFGGVTEPKPKAAATVTLTAVSAPGSGPVSWSGCESEPEGNCVVLMSKAQSVTATFNELE